jgi:hypothetical protein
MWQGVGTRHRSRLILHLPSLQLFRRVASALPGMENVQEKSKEGSILFLGERVKACIWEATGSCGVSVQHVNTRLASAWPGTRTG